MFTVLWKLILLIFLFFAKLCTFATSKTKKEQVMAYKISEECIACGTCIDECPVEAISEGDIYKIDADLCTDCGSCAEVCPVDAISIAE
jgi:ferredoxin